MIDKYGLPDSKEIDRLYETYQRNRISELLELVAAQDDEINRLRAKVSELERARVRA